MTGRQNFSARSATIAADPVRAGRLDAARVRVRDEHRRYEANLSHIRKARQSTQVALAKLLGITQPEVSRVERQADLYLSTLRRYVEALGGELRITARFAEGDVDIVLDRLLDGSPAEQALSPRAPAVPAVRWQELPAVSGGSPVRPAMCVTSTGDFAMAA